MTTAREAADGVRRREKGLEEQAVLAGELADFQRRLDRSPAGDEQLAVGEVVDDVGGFHLVVRAFGDQIEADDPFAAALADLAAGLLEGQVKAGQRVEIGRPPGPGFGRGEGGFGFQVVHLHELFLAELTEGLEVVGGVGRGHGADCRASRGKRRDGGDGGAG